MANYTDMDIIDVLLERPIPFKYKHHTYSLYPPSLGKMHLIIRICENLGISINNESISPIGLMSLVDDKRQDCIRLIAYCTLYGKECLDENKVEKRVKRLRGISQSSIVALLYTILTFDKTSMILSKYGIDKNREQLSRILEIKGEDKNSVSFGGLSVWGSIVDVACERYGWTVDYVLWGVSYCNLIMLLNDHVNTIYLTDDERKLARVSSNDNVINADNREELVFFINHHNWS